MGSCRNDLLQKDWNQFGPDAFEFEELDILTPSEDPNYNPAEDLEFLKDMWIEKLKPFAIMGIIDLQVVALNLSLVGTARIMLARQLIFRVPRNVRL